MAEFLVETYRIVNLTKASEYFALSDNDKEWYKLFVSAGIINLEEGSLAKEKLWDMFDEESNTGRDFRNINNGLLPNPPIV